MESEKFVWLELKPQQKFKDDNENKIFEIIKHASEFAFFVLREDDTIRLIVRTPEDNQNLFRTIPGISVEDAGAPRFDKMVAKYLVLKNRHSLVPLIDLKTITKSNVYQKMWHEKKSCMMACFVHNRTENMASKVDARIKALEDIQNTKGARLSSKKREELAAAVKKRDGYHAYYNCCVLFGVKTCSAEPQEMQEERGRRKEEEDNAFESKVGQIKSLDRVQFEQEHKKLKESHQEALKKIEKDFVDRVKKRRDNIRESTKALDKLVGNVLLTSFSHRISRRKVKFLSGKKSLGQRLAEIFGATGVIDPATFVPRKLYSKSMVLTEVELAFFISFPQEYDIQTINFGTGPTPTFVHGRTEDMDKTNLTIQCSHEVSDDDIEKLNRSVVSGLRVICTRCNKPVMIKRDGKGGYVIESDEDSN